MRLRRPTVEIALCEIVDADAISTDARIGTDAYRRVLLDVSDTQYNDAPQ